MKDERDIVMKLLEVKSMTEIPEHKDKIQELIDQIVKDYYKRRWGV